MLIIWFTGMLILAGFAGHSFGRSKGFEEGFKFHKDLTELREAIKNAANYHSTSGSITDNPVAGIQPVPNYGSGTYTKSDNPTNG